MHTNPNLSVKQQEHALATLQEAREGDRNRMESWLQSYYEHRCDGDDEGAERCIQRAIESMTRAQASQDVMVALRRSIQASLACLAVR